jgi:hypothetical protein
MFISGEWEFCAKLDCPDRKSAPSLRDDVFTAQWLRGYKQDVFIMNAMRNLCLQDGTLEQLSRLSDEMIADRISRHFAAGKLHVHPRPLDPSAPLRLAGSAESVPPSPPSVAAPPRVKVKIDLVAGSIACPGQLLKIIARGTPAGGTFQWNLDLKDPKAPTADLVTAFRKSTRAGPEVYLWGFNSDPESGNIPEQKADVSVTYTYTDGQTDWDNKHLIIHGINFQVTDDTVDNNSYKAFERREGIIISAWRGQIMSSKPTVEIQLDDCPIPKACAHNHKVGWVQKVTSYMYEADYTSATITTADLPLPLPDRRNKDDLFVTGSEDFKKNNDKLTAQTADSPGVGNAGDKRAGTETPLPWTDEEDQSNLQRIQKKMGLTSWLAVQNIEWSKKDPAGCFAFLRHFRWSTVIDAKIDTSKSLGSRATLEPNDPKIPSRLVKGRGTDENPAMPEKKVAFNVAANLKALQHRTPHS